MKKESNKKELNSYIESVKNSQKNVLWPDVLRGGHSVDELFWKGTRGAPLIQRIGIMLFALAYLMLAVMFLSMAIEQGSWLAAGSTAILLGIGGWFIRNALRK
jgi:hypothetical protein